MTPPEILSLAHVPYADGGRDPATGLDCWGFYREARRRLGLSVPPLHQVSGEDGAEAEWLKARQSPEWPRLVFPEPYCLVLLIRPGRPTHCGIVLPNRVSFAHLCQQGFRTDLLDGATHRLARKEYFRYAK